MILAHISSLISLLAISFNQPTLSSCAIWSSNAITFINETSIGLLPFGLFVNEKDQVYIPARLKDEIDIYYANGTDPNRTVSGDLSKPHSVFVNDNGDIYVDNGGKNSRIDKWTANQTKVKGVMKTNGTCHGLFLDNTSMLYCSMGDFDQVIKQSIINQNNQTIIAAGDGNLGFGSSMLFYPQGIFVDTLLFLYVADCGNNRIQRFVTDEPYNGTTIVGNGSSVAVLLDCPTSVTLDRNASIFIVDSGNHRIIRTEGSNWRCLVGCFSTGSKANQLSNPKTLSFDSIGNMFVTDSDNDRIQKFLLIANTCSKYYSSSATHDQRK